ncbi:hypothetical protein [Aureivirga marina]|uniref:hypothetical protein n=1 Tax=Aureivirga marina TaxID=1182451 RepID=UPI0018CACBC6|nr:hypothetical protein [Aureivirga marina]
MIILMLGLVLRIGHTSLFHVSNTKNELSNQEQNTDYWNDNNLLEKCLYCFYDLKLFSQFKGESKEFIGFVFNKYIPIEFELKYILKESSIFNSRAPPLSYFLFK